MQIRILICAVALMASGCGKKQTTAPVAPPPPTKGVSMEDASAAAPPPPPPQQVAAAPGGAAPTEVAGDPEAARQRELLRLKPPQGDGEIPTQKLLIWAIDRWEERYPVLPKDVNELVAKGLLKPLPPPPAGKKYRLDAHNRELTLVDNK